MMVRSMKKSRDNHFADIDSTLDYLIENANILRSIALNVMADRERQHLKDIQDNLLTRLMDRASVEPEADATRIRTTKKPRIGRNRRSHLKAS